MAPYRTVEHDERAEAPRDPGIVGDIIEQFADSFAFLRELVQNAIDAGTPSVEVRIDHDAGAGTARVAVRDRGEGMTRDVIENQLLVLFRSTKERDDSKIGKFGIGFVSVLAAKPSLVVVQTAREGRRLTVHLHPDLTYEVFDAGPATQHGTTVELELVMTERELPAFAAGCRHALERWCRHATVPIELVAAGASVRIDRPLALDGVLVEVRATADEGRLVALVGLPAERGAYAGFFNHGLTLHESAEPLIGRLAFKVQDARLGHTLSRDNVRRDERFRRAVAFARELAERELPGAAARALEAAAHDSDGAGRDRYDALVRGIEGAAIELRSSEWWFPLVEPVGDRRALRATELGGRAWASPHRSRLTATLAAAGVPVLRGRELLELRARELTGCRVAEAAAELTAVEIVDGTPEDFVLLGALGEVLAAAHRAPAKLVLARLAGACASGLAIAGGVDDAVAVAVGPRAPYVLDRDTAKRNPFAMLRRPPLVLSVDHPIVAAARRAEPHLAASHLARAILLHYRLLDVDRSRAILDHTLARLGVA